MKREPAKRVGMFFLFLLLALTFSCVTPIGDAGEGTVQAASSTIKTVSGGKWKTKSKKVYYMNSKGKKTKGLVEINGKNYYFDSKGVQRTGWQKIKGDYYYFKIATGKKGYMVKNKKVNSVKLKKNGKASTSGNAKTRLKVLVKANQVVEKATKPTMTKKEKLKATWDYILKKYRYSGSPTFKKGSHWDQTYALDFFNKKHGNCYAFGAAFAYLGNACGYTNCYAISSGGHGWAEINGKVYDPTWAMQDKKHNYYGRSYDSKASGVPNYKKSRYYVKKI